jgi:WD40 repeat protein
MGNVCVDGACVPAIATCSSDGLARFDADGTVTSCAPFKCKGGACATSCGTSSDCASGLVCANAQCVAAPAADDSGGCAVTRASSPKGVWLIAGAAILLLARRRRSALGAAALAAVSCSPSRVDPPATHTTSQPIAIASAPETLYPHARAWALTLSGGDVLVGGGEVIGKPERRNASTGKWSEAAWSGIAFESVAVPIPGGKVLVAGADSSPTPEVFDPATNTSTPTGAMIGSHRYAIGVWLPSVGRALVAGGTGPSTLVSTAEVWNPSTGTWSATGALRGPRVLHQAVTLSTGRVLVIGGSSTGGFSTPLSTVESYDPATGTWSLVAPMTRPRGQPAVVLLADGRVLVAGGADATAEIYAPSTNTWTALPSMASPRAGTMAARLPSGRALVAGASDGTIEVYDSVRNAWLPAGSLTTKRSLAATTTLVDGRLLFVGGYDASSAAVWDVDIFTEQANGATCTGGGECTSGFCVDGRCCNSACTGACQACDVTGSLGTCSGISGLPRTGHPSCAPYVSCVAGSCAASCASDSDCASTSWCSAGACVAKKANGASCTAAAQCTSGSCADGVCCTTACTGQCEACAETGKVGTCTTIAGAPRGTRAPCTGIAVGGQCGIQCNGVEPKGCVYPPATRSCSAAACTSGVETHASTCNGVGLCNDVPKTCGAFACGTSACKTTCAVTTDCASGFVCKSATCVPAPGLGMPCSTSAPCEGGLFCVDGVCCGESTCGSGKSCGLPATAGRCAKIDGQTCAADGECGSGVCVDGVCCESRCGGQCQACDVAGSLGKCVAVSGTPHGARPACAKGAMSCEATSCDGSDGSRCAALADSTVSCRDASCTENVATLAASCDGKGTCGDAVTVACAPYKCAGAACATSCATSADCAKGYECAAGACTKAIARCSSDGVAVVDPDGRRASCLPFRCRDASCLAKCATSDDCAAGTLCDGSGACTTAPVVAAAEEDDGGCTYSRVRSTRSVSGVALLVTAMVAAAARRRRFTSTRRRMEPARWRPTR